MKAIAKKPYHAPMTKARRRMLRDMAARCSGICPYTGVAWPETDVRLAYEMWLKLGRPRWTSMVRHWTVAKGNTFKAKPKAVTRYDPPPKPRR